MSNNYNMYTTVSMLETAAHSLLSEQSVLERVSDDPNVFFQWWPSYQHNLYHGCLAWMGNQQDAEDALSEIVLKAWKRLPIHADKISNLKGWLNRLSYNHCMDRLRQGKRERHHRVELQRMIEADAQIVGDHLLPPELVEGAERSDYLYRAIRRLPERLREVVILRFWQDKSYQQIADHFGVTSSAVGMSLQEARSLLSKEMADYLEGNHDLSLAQSVDNQVTLNKRAGELLWKEAQALSKERAEIQVGVTVIYCPVQVTLPNTALRAEPPRERTFILPLRKKATRVEQKIRSLQAHIQRHPTDWKKKLQLADLYYGIGRWQEASEGYREILEKRPREFALYLRLGQIFCFLERFDTAIAVYEDALSQARQHSTRHHLRGLIAFCRRQYTLAATHFTAATKLSPDNAAHWHLLGQVHLAREAYQDALWAYDMALSLNPDDLIALSESYEPLMVMGHFTEALQHVRRTLLLAPHDLHAVKRLADYRCRMGWVSGEGGKETKKLIRVARKVAPQAAYAEAARATYHLYRGKWGEGLAVLQDVVKKEPLNPDNWYQYALCLAQCGDSALASDAILAALALTKDDYRLYYAACDILPTAGRESELRALVQQMLDRFPERFRIWCHAGRALVLLGDEQGCMISAKATQLQPQLAEPWLEHGRTLALAGKDEQAIAALLTGYEYIAQDAALLSVRASVWLAEGYQHLSDETNSGQWWQEAARRAPELIQPNIKKPSGTSLPMAHYWQGRVLEGLGCFDAAMQRYQTALDHHLLYPARQDALNRLSLTQTAHCPN